MSKDIPSTTSPTTTVGTEGILLLSAAEDADKRRQQEHEHLLKEIETSDSSTVGHVLRAIYDGDDHAKFLEKLRARIDDHSREIQKMCNFHYQGFIDSINELLQVKSQAAKLKGEVSEIHAELSDSTEKALAKGEALVRVRRTQCNIKAAIEALSICLPVLDMYSKLNEQMAAKRHYPALKTIELLEHTYLPLIQRHKFAQTMGQRLPRFRAQIEEASMTELKDFLESIRKHSAHIGDIAIVQASEQYQIEAEGFTHGAINSVSNGPTSGVKLKKPSSISGPSDGENTASVGTAQDLVDFSPVYRCYHIFGVLGNGERFRTYYRSSREEQAKLALQSAFNMHASLEGYRAFFNEVAGFFVVEEHVANTAGGLVSRTELETSWAEACHRVEAALRTSTGYCTEAPLMLRVKTLIMLFAYTLKGYGYKVDPLIKLLLEVYEHYNEILMKTCKDSFRQLFEVDSYHPMQVDTEEEYRRVLSKFPFRDEVLERSPFPRKFPFSSFVPAVYTYVKDFVGESLKFLQDLNLSQSEVEDMVRKSTNLLLTRTLSGCLTALIEKPSLGLLQLIQITINTNYLEETSFFLEEHIQSIFRSPASAGGSASVGSGVGTNSGTGVSSHATRLQGKAIFKDSRKNAEDQIYKQIKRKIDESIELATYEWTAAEARGTASAYMLDLIAFLNNVFQAFTNLPVRGDICEFKDRVAQTACMTACQHLSGKLLDLLRNEEVKAISTGAVEQFNLDLIQCEQFATSEPVQGLNADVLPMFFVELRQLVDLVMDEDWQTYLQEKSDGRNDAKYLRVQPTTALIVLEKVCAADKKRNTLLNFNQKQKERKKLLEWAVKQLRIITQANGVFNHNNNSL
ncbi:exocyst complex component 6-like isoform X3 [Varroa jacobsoni]|uniref:Exocyst complex component n=1 Tax=Varroa destructor TaxID=109461 RepID=A0A7M7KA91_VARDE|nr:exocyst complex component 6-like isoform X3 [Varroa destructor]XP_022662837.1 exocyst complex component 6-like isoform X3 [Varroa destructor]XP_022662838.1 exocyst complex component 6-like isoform X3 [Varroa destructor]XP_022662839.1 exocyst complex component 6-like isoform X3 [Varroa destructor]XP_022686969.1 exocyst complex component 6-like isoform X3 [Varroa jacobsoni]XP_022686970.1 exocyst complex component 6-like isoform X3 [Varroa jacobsoni]XP_022686971.1 exocyst complex component 6-